MKIPVVSTRITGVPEIVEDGVTGFLVPDRDERALASAMNKLIKNKKLRDSFGENARNRIENNFNINKNVSEYVDLFNNFLN